jgi:subtilisin family serine protease
MIGQSWRRAAAAALGVATTLGVLATGGPASAAPATGQIRLAAGATAIPGSYIVGLRSGSSPSTVAGKYGGAVTHTYGKVFSGFAANMSEAAARRLAADPAVAWVEQDSVVRLDDTQNGATQGLDRIDQRNLPLDRSYTFATTATNVHAYIIDTGIRISHHDFGGRASVGTDTVGDGRNGIDCNGHGTHVSGTVGGATFGVAKGVSLVAVRVLDCGGSGTNAGVIAGVDWVTANAIKPAVANMSLGGGASAALDQAVQRSIAAGVTYAVAAGNSNANACNSSPSRTPEAITVGATDVSDNRASFSNFGSCLDIFGPGVNITSDWMDNDDATNTISGTSMATPHVAGAAALVLAGSPGASPASVRNALVGNGTTGKVVNAGASSPNVLLFTGAGGQQPPTGPIFSNGTDVAIPDAGAAVTSPITVSGVAGNAPASLAVSVTIIHTWRGDLVVDVLAPDGTVFPLKGSVANDSADDVRGTFSVNASGHVANGTWLLRVRDVARLDTGRIDTWSLQF